MLPEELPQEILARFRTVSLQRVERIESCWSALTTNGGSEGHASVVLELQRELHTLKGDSRVVGFADINLLCHHLEDVLGFARRREFLVSEDLDMAATMGFRFIGMLLRKRVGTNLGGIDLVGFIDQINHALHDAATGESRTAGGAGAATPAQRARSGAGARGSTRPDHLGPPARATLAWAATRVFLEHLNAGGRSRARLHEVWQALSGQLASVEQTGLGPLLARHAQAATQLARDLGKHVELGFDLDDVSVSNDVAEAIDVAVLHLLRNAVDHGIEEPSERRACGKPPGGRVTLRARSFGHGDRGDGDDGGCGVELEIEDDGAGVDFAAVAERARAEALVAPAGAAPEVSEAAMIDWLFRPGFSTATAVSDVSGRGLGLDAVRAALQPVRGTIEFRTRAQVGSMVKLRFERAGTQVQVRHFLAPRGDVRLAVRAGWRTRVGDASVDAIDPLAALGVLPTTLARARRTIGVRLTRKDSEVLLAGAGPVAEGVAERICPTDDDVPVEVVRLERAECLLLRPELLRM